MDDYKIALGALLDANAKGDIDKQLNAIKDLSVTISKATLSNDVINDIKRQLTQNGIDLELVFGNVNQITNQAKQTGQQIGQQIQNGINNAIQKGNLQKDFFFSADKKNGVAKQAQEYFRGISNGVVTVTEQMENLDDKSELRGFIVNIKNAKGEVESLKYSLRNILDDNGNVTGQKFAYVSGSINDAGAIKQFEELNKVITDYEIKLANLKTKYSNMNVDYSAFNDVFDNFKLGIGTTNDLALAFNQLENSAKKGVQSLKSQTSSFDPIQQTLNNMRDLPSMLTALEANMSGIKDKTSVAEISVADLRNTFNELEMEMTNSGGKVPLTDEWLTKYRELMSTVTSATKQVDALKKAEASDNSQTQKQASYYSTLLSNYREIYSLKKKLITAGEEESKVIKEQIRSLNSSNASINNQLGKQGLKDSDWQSQVDDLKEELDYSLRISEARQKDKANQSNLNDAQRESIQIVEELEQAYQRVQDIKVKIASLDKEKDGEKISTLSQEERTAQDEYNQLYNKLRKRKNYDKESWNETKSAIDAATKSQIEFNNAKSQDTLNKAQKTEVANFNILKDKWEEQGVLVGEFKTKVEQMESALASVGSKGELDNLKLQIKDLKTEADKIAEVNRIQLSWSDGSYEAKYDSLIAKTRQWVDANDESVISTQKLTTAYNEFNQAASNFAKDGSVKNRDILIQKEEELGRQLKATTNDIKVQNAEWAKSSKVDSLHQKIQEFYDKNTATHRTWGSQLKNMLNETAHGAQVTATRVNEIEQEFLGVSNAARQAGKLGQSFFGSIKEQASKFVQWFSVTSVVMEGVQAIKKMTQEVIAVDSAMVELRKVSDASNNDLKNYFDEAAKSAKDLGAAVSDVISATADWSRLGYSLDDSKKLAEVAILYKNVGDGIYVDTANESLVSTLRGFQLSAEDAMNIVDQFNEVANNFPIDSAGIGEALQRSAASFYEANTDLSKSIALITGTNSVIQDPDSVGTMWKTVSMRIRGATAELEEAGLETEGMVETTSQLQALVKGMTGFDIMKDEDTFKDIYEIVIGIGNEWQNLSDIEQASLLEALAGKRQGNALAAALNNISMIEDAYNTATNSAGSALEEQEEYEKGIQYSLDRLEAKFQEFSNHVLESELIKGIVDFGTTTLDIVDKVTSALGSLGTIGVIGGGILGAKNAGICV